MIWQIFDMTAHEVLVGFLTGIGIGVLWIIVNETVWSLREWWRERNVKKY